MRGAQRRGNLMRLNKLLASAGLGSRRKVEELIKSGKVKVNDLTVTNLATVVNPQKDIIKAGGQVIAIEPKVYILLNKPPGYLTTVADERGRKTILDLVKVKERIFPVGRLDMNSRGLLILTNDGDLAVKLLHPRHKIPKTYIVKVNASLSEDQLDKFRKGIEIDGQKTAPAKINVECRVLNVECYQVVLTEGRKRQIRRMFEALGFKVLDLKRVQIGPIKLSGLKEGNWRYSTDKELKKLKESISL